jgi:hypothetical protein
MTGVVVTPISVARLEGHAAGKVAWEEKTPCSMRQAHAAIIGDPT